MSIHDNITTPTPEELAAVVYQVLAALPTHRVKYDPRDEFEPDVDDGFDYGHEGADRLEARETAHREWRAR